MATCTPLAPATDSTLNYVSASPIPVTSQPRLDETEAKPDKMESSRSSGELPSQQRAATPDDIGNISSPFVSCVQDSKTETPVRENVELTKQRHSRIMSGHEIAPLKILSTTREESSESEARSTQRPSSMHRTPRKAIERRFPVKVSNGVSSPDRPAPDKTPDNAGRHITEEPVAPSMHTTQPKHVFIEHEMTLEDAMRNNAQLKNVIDIFEDEEGGDNDDDDDDSSFLRNVEHEADMTSVIAEAAPPHAALDEAAAADESTFSNFSAVPNMTMYARIGHSPSRLATMGSTPTLRGRPDPNLIRSATRPPTLRESGNTTSMLMDFTDQLSSFSSKHGPPSPGGKGRQSPVKTSGHQANGTPHRQSNLLDFDIPPMPTPRSVPTVTPREVESLKSAFLSEISSLKASLLGKEAEVSSLKNAMSDAEKRVGECMEELHETRCIKEALAEEKATWEIRGREMEAVLRQVKSEMGHNQHEREELEYKLDESEKRREAAEMMAQEAESKMAGMRAGKGDVFTDGIRSPDRAPRSPNARDVEVAVERVARELHALYKGKHETKVAALKKSYETRWEKRVMDLEARIEELAVENEKLKTGRDAAMRVDPAQVAADEERKAQLARNAAQIRELTTEVDRLEATINSVKQDNSELIQLLEKERVEKGELVQLAEEMMSIQHSYVQQQDKPAAATAPAPAPTATPRRTESKLAQSSRSSISRPPSGLRLPASVKKVNTESRIGGLSHERARSVVAPGALARSGSGPQARHSMLSSMDRMGAYRGRAE